MQRGLNIDEQRYTVCDAYYTQVHTDVACGVGPLQGGMRIYPDHVSALAMI